MDETRNQAPGPAGEPEDYDPPTVEEVLSADDLAREVHYAGVPGSPIIG